MGAGVVSDVVVTVPRGLWNKWIAEGDLPGDEWDGNEYHFWFGGPQPDIRPGERVYIVAHDRLRGYAPLVRTEARCALWTVKHCLVRRGDAVAVTVCAPMRGFRGWRYRFWPREDEYPMPSWEQP